METSSTGRAKQFMAFAALRGYYDLVRERERVVEPKKILSSYEAMKLSYKLNQVKKGMMVELVYYNKTSYDKIVGMVSSIDEAFKLLTIVTTQISFDDILDVNGNGIEEFD